MDNNPIKLDPMDEREWTLAMLAAWVMWRRPDEVRDYWHRCRSEPMGMGAVVFEALANAVDEEFVVEPSDAELQIKYALAGDGDEKLTVHGLPRGHRHEEVIAPGLLKQAVFPIEDIDQRRWHDALFVYGEDDPAYLSVTVDRDEALRIWPAAGASSLAAFSITRLWKRLGAIIGWILEYSHQLRRSNDTSPPPHSSASPEQPVMLPVPNAADTGTVIEQQGATCALTESAHGAARAFSSKAAQETYRRRIEEWQGPVPPTEDQDVEFMKRAHPGITRNAVRAMRPDELKKRGPRGPRSAKQL